MSVNNTSTAVELRSRNASAALLAARTANPCSSRDSETHSLIKNLILNQQNAERRKFTKRRAHDRLPRHVVLQCNRVAALAFKLAKTLASL